MSGEEKEKLRIVLKHWIEHNEDHSGEFREWAEKANALGEARVRDSILKAAEQLDEANLFLERALGQLSSDDS